MVKPAGFPAIAAMVALAVIMLAAGCGRKTPPVMPKPSQGSAIALPGLI
ncbi:MAG: hypothetical protein HY751_03480 [Nitrospinae bacterium]|nr:hypothetical protein [Nitrospinota bacterium]